MAFKKIGTTYNEAANEWAEHYECDYEWEVANLPACNPGSSVKVLSTGKEYEVGINGLWGGGTGGGGADIDVTAEVGQIIRVKSVDANGKPTEWESAEYPVGAKIYTKSDIEKMTLEELRAEYEKHPLIYRIETDGGRRADILLHCTRTGVFCGAGLSEYPSQGVCVRIYKNAADQYIFDERNEKVLTLGSGAETGLLYYGSGLVQVKSIDDITNSIEIETAIAELPAEYLVDGATLPVGYEDFVNIYAKYNKIPNLVIRTMIDDVPVDLNALYVSTDMTTFTTVVKFLSPTTNDIITINLTLSAG